LVNKAGISEFLTFDVVKFYLGRSNDEAIAVKLATKKKIDFIK
jgi:hypothetical protein